MVLVKNLCGLFHVHIGTCLRVPGEFKAYVKVISYNAGFGRAKRLLFQLINFFKELFLYFIVKSER